MHSCVRKEGFGEIRRIGVSAGHSDRGNGYLVFLKHSLCVFASDVVDVFDDGTPYHIVKFSCQIKFADSRDPCQFIQGDLGVALGVDVSKDFFDAVKNGTVRTYTNDSK